MKIVKLNKVMGGSVSCWEATMELPDGSERLFPMALSSDGELWVDPKTLGIGPQHAPQLAQFPGGNYLLTHPAKGLVFINARAVVLVSKDAAWCHEWLNCVDAITREFRKEHELVAVMRQVEAESRQLQMGRFRWHVAQQKAHLN